MNAFPEDPCGAGTPARENVEHSAVSPDGLRQVSTEVIPAAQVDPISPTLSGAPVLPDIPPDPAWNALDLLRLTLLTIVALFLGVFAVLFVTRFLIYPHSSLSDLSRFPLVMVAGQALAYLLVLAYMYILVTRERHRPDFRAAIHWNSPSFPALYVLVGFVLSVALQILASRMPIPKNLPIDTLFRTPAEAWVLTIFGITLAPLMEELFFRGFLYPVLARRWGAFWSILVTALLFALIHSPQYGYSWAAVLIVCLVGVVLTTVRAVTKSVASSFLAHVGYNATLMALAAWATDGFRHMEKAGVLLF